MQTADLNGADLAYWVARANMRGSRFERDVLRSHYGTAPHQDPNDETAMRAFVESKLGQTLPERSAWQ